MTPTPPTEPVAELRLGKHTQHGLGQFLNPIDPDSDDRNWVTQAWLYLAADDLGIPKPDLPWLDLPALCRYTVTNPNLLAAFRRHNIGRDRAEQVWSFNFILVARVHPFGVPVAHKGGPFRLIAPYETNSARWYEMPWINKDAPRDGTYTITTDLNRDEGTSPREAIVVSYCQVLHDYLNHPEAKYADAHGQPCGPDTRGRLHRHPIHLTSLRLIGKEANEIAAAEAGLTTPMEEQVALGRHDLQLEAALAATAYLGGRALAQRLGVDRRTVDRFRRGTKPGTGLRSALVDLARQAPLQKVHTGDQLEDDRQQAENDPGDGHAPLHVSGPCLAQPNASEHEGDQAHR